MTALMKRKKSETSPEKIYTREEEFEIFEKIRAGEKAALEGRYDAGTDLLPDARHVLDLPPTLLSHTLAPIYGRGPDARLPV